MNRPGQLLETSFLIFERRGARIGLLMGAVILVQAGELCFRIIPTRLFNCLRHRGVNDRGAGCMADGSAHHFNPQFSRLP